MQFSQRSVTNLPFKPAVSLSKKISRFKLTNLTNLFTLMFFASIFNVAEAQDNKQIEFQQVQIFLNEFEVSKESKVEVVMISRDAKVDRMNNPDSVLDINTCYTLTFTDPYGDQTWKPFTGTVSCQSSDPTNIKVQCEKVPNQPFMIKYWFTQVNESVAKKQLVPITITGYTHPFSALKVPVTLQQYSDLACTKKEPRGGNRDLFRPVRADDPGIQVQAASIGSNLKISTSLKGLQVQEGNEISFEVTQTSSPLPPSRAGKIELTLPINWQDNLTGDKRVPFDGVTWNTDSCTGDFTVTRITQNTLLEQVVSIYYKDLTQSKLAKGSSLTIKCKNFINPIYQQIQSGYKIKFKDAYQESLIMESFDAELDASKYDVYKLKPSSLSIAPYAEGSSNTEQIKVGQELGDIRMRVILNQNEDPDFRLGRKCYILVRVASDMVTDINLINSPSVQGIFKSSRLSGNTASSNQFSIKKSDNSILFQACGEDLALKGNVGIPQLKAQDAVFHSQKYYVEIFKDEDMEQKIATVDGQTFPSEDQELFSNTNKILAQGQLSGLYMQPLVSQVQIVSQLNIKFSIETRLWKNARVELYLPSNLGVPDVGTKLNISPQQGSTQATEGIVQEVTADKKKMWCQYFALLSENQDCFLSLGFDQTKYIVIDNLVLADEGVPSQHTFEFGINGIANQISTVPTTRWFVVTYLKKGEEFYVVDMGGTSESQYFNNPSGTHQFTATKGLLTAVGEVEIDTPVNYKPGVTYIFKFQEDSMVPADGFYEIIFPTDISFVEDELTQKATCAELTCKIVKVEGQPIKLRIYLKEEAPKKQEFTLKLGGMKNSRSFQPSGSFTILSYDSKENLIDEGYNKNVATTEAGEITFEILNPLESNTNGQIKTYQFRLTSSVPFRPNDVIKFSFPPQLEVNAEGQTIVTPADEKDKLNVGISGNDIQIILQELAERPETIDSYTQSIEFSMTNIRNPPSLQLSDPFSNFKLLTPNNYLISEDKKKDQGRVQNQVLAVLTNDPIVHYKLFQSSLLDSSDPANPAYSDYTITIVPINPLPADGSIKIEMSSSVKLRDGASTKCLVTTNKLYAQNCKVEEKDGKTYLIITGVFATAAPYSSEIIIMVQGVRNPIDNKPELDSNDKPTNGFSIWTYGDAEMKYGQDIVEQVLVPKLACNYPCKGCTESDKSDCTLCWTHDQKRIPDQFLMSLPGQKGVCKTKCDFGYTTNKDPNKRCVACDTSCDGCLDVGMTEADAPNLQPLNAENKYTGNVEDYKQCLKCSATHPYRLEDRENNLRICLNTCNQGIFSRALFEKSDSITPVPGAPKEKTCAICDYPCKGCIDSETKCTSCFQEKTAQPQNYLDKIFKPNLHEDTCKVDCPDDHTSVAGVCVKCEAPCGQCNGAPTICKNCITDKFFLLESTCYENCPVQYANDPDAKPYPTCKGCLSGCDVCNPKDTSICTRCSENLYLHQMGGATNNTCQGFCPEGYKGIDRVCVVDDDDMKVLYFPFLIAAFIFTIVVFFGKLKKKAILVNGIPKKMSNQWSVVAIISSVSLLQSIAILTQAVLAVLLKQKQFMVFVMSAGLFVALLVFNLVFLVWYVKTFQKTYLPAIGSRITHKGREIDVNQNNFKKYPQPVDKLYYPWYTKHVFTTIMTYVFCVINWKVYKIQYSRFFMFDMFKAHWEKATLLRTRQDKYGYVYLGVIDVLAIVVCIVGIGMVGFGWSNQLQITLIETIVLTIYLIILQFIEAFYMKQIFEYTEKDDKNKTSNAMKKYAGKKGRKLQMNNLLKQVKTGSNNTFKTNKWEDLLEQFGGRRCKSMIELGTGWPDEEDPRHVHTWPISRDEEDKIVREHGGEIKKFTADDAFALQDNCYAEGVHKLKGKDKNVQGDAAKLEFQNALNRKHGDLMAREDETDEMHTKKGTRRRGRKNKYHNQIDLEDDQEIDPDEASDKDADLQIIKEQEEEEEALRKMVQESSKKQQEVTAARAQRIQQEKLTREQQKEREAGELKLKQQQEAQALKKQQMIDALRLQKEEEERKRLEEEAANILKQRELQEQEELLKKQKESEAARKQYEADEAARKQKEEEERQRKLKEEEELLQQENARQRQEREDALAKAKKAQEEEDARKLLEAKLLQEEQEKQRAKEKEDERERLEKERNDRHKKEEEEKLAKQLEYEKTEQEAKEKKELDRKNEQERKEAQRAARDAEKAEKEAEAKLAKEKRREEEEKEREERKKKKAQAMAGVDDSEELPDRAKSTLKKESEKASKSQLADEPDTQLEKKPSTKKELEKMQSQTQSQADDDVNSSIVNVNQNVMKDFQEKRKEEDALINIPPNSGLRTFNEHDILGDLDRDEKGNVVVLQDKNGRQHDKQRKPVNPRGYLMDPKTNDLIENMTGQPMFRADEVDERGELPAPFAIEKHNFNPHKLMGDFDYQDGKPILMKTSQGFYIDKKARRVNKHGWFSMVGRGDLVDKDGRKKFDKKQLNDEDIHRLFNYNGKRFDIKDVMGQFDKDQNGNIVPQNNGNGKLTDNLGRLVNDKGYLIDEQGNIIDVNKKQIWKRTDLKSNEFPKIFPFTKFNIQRVQGDLDVNSNGTPMLKKTNDGSGYQDKKGRLINQKGYLIDKQGNVIDTHGKVVFDKCVLDGGEIPQVFRTGMLRSDTASSLSRLMSEIERGNQSDYPRGQEVANDSAYERLKNNDGDTSVDSKMEDTPANYNMANQRFDSDGNNEPIPEDDEGAEHMAPSDFSEQDEPTILQDRKRQKPKKKKKKAKLQTIEFLEPTNREKNMAGAYGGMARGEIRRPGIKYDKERLQNSKKFRVSTADEPKVRAQLNELAKTVGSFPPNQEQPALLPRGSRVTDEKPPTKKQGFMKASDGLSSHSRSGMEKQQVKKPQTQKKRGINDADFEQMFGKDIDQFLEDSEWDLESQDKVSQGSRASRASAANKQKLKAMEKVYLKRMEQRPENERQGRGRSAAGSGLGMNQGKKSKNDVRGPDRETIIAVTDDPGVIHRGEILPFETKKTFKR